MPTTSHLSLGSMPQPAHLDLRRGMTAVERRRADQTSYRYATGPRFAGDPRTPLPYAALPAELDCACGGTLRKSPAASRSFVCDACEHRAWISDDGSAHWNKQISDDHPDHELLPMGARRCHAAAAAIPARCVPREVQRVFGRELAKRRLVIRQLNQLAASRHRSAPSSSASPHQPNRWIPTALKPHEEAILDDAVAPFLAPTPYTEELEQTAA